MANKELVDYLLSIRDYSYPEQTVVNVLRQAGWPDEEIESAFNVVHGLEQTTSYAWIKAGTVMALLVVAVVFGISTQFSSSITGNVVGVRLEASIPLTQTEPEAVQFYEVTVLEEVVNPAVFDEPAEIQVNAPAPVLPVLADCGKLQSRETRDDCVQKYAFENNDPELCMRLSDSEKFSSCIQHAAITLKRSKLCQTLTDVTGCLNAYAKATGDKTVCAWITNNAQRTACEA